MAITKNALDRTGFSFKSFWIWTVVAGIVFLLYFPILDYGFRGEEYQVLYLVKHNLSFFDSFISQFLGTFRATNCFYRPIPRELSYFIVTSLFGFGPLAFRIILFILFLINIFLVYALTKIFTPHKTIAFLSAIFFASRGCHFDLMYWILFGFENLILGIFIFATVLFYSYFLRTSKKQYLLICYCLTFLALLTKESAFVLPFYIALTHLILAKSSFKKLFFSVLPFACITCIFISRFFVANNTVSGGMLKISLGNIFAPYTLAKNVLWYVYNCFNSPFELGFCVFIVCISFVFYHNIKSVLFCLGWFFLSLIPFIAIKGPYGGYLFIPVLGISILVAKSIPTLLQKISFNKAICIVLICCVFVLSGFNNLRSKDTTWQESEGFITDVQQYFDEQFPSFPDKTLIYIKRKDLSSINYWRLGFGYVFMLKHDNISVYFDSSKKEPSGHYNYIYYFTLSDDSMKFIGRESNLLSTEKTGEKMQKK